MNTDTRKWKQAKTVCHQIPSNKRLDKLLVPAKEYIITCAVMQDTKLHLSCLTIEDCFGLWNLFLKQLLGSDPHWFGIHLDTEKKTGKSIILLGSWLTLQIAIAVHLHFKSFKRFLLCVKELVQNLSVMKSSVAKRYGCKCTRHCGLIAKGSSQVNQDFPV